MSPTVLSTLVCFVNGAANLYFNLGGEYVNAAARYRGVAQASFDFIKNATACLDCCEKTTKFDMPTAGKNFVYLLTKGGVYKTEIAPNAIPKEAESKKKPPGVFPGVAGHGAAGVVYIGQLSHWRFQRFLCGGPEPGKSGSGDSCQCDG